MFALKTIPAFAALLGMVHAQTDALDVRALASTAQCPATQGPDVNANVLAVVRFVETATASVAVGPVSVLEAQLRVDLDVCLCVDANVAVGAIDFPANLKADAIADIEAYAAARATVDSAADTFNQIVNVVGGPVADVNVDLVPVQRTSCVCPAGATPTCSNGTCSCDCPTGFFYDAANGRCVLQASGAVNGRRSKMPAYIKERQAKRSTIARA